jgi:hypothetical protein
MECAWHPTACSLLQWQRLEPIYSNIIRRRVVCRACETLTDVRTGPSVWLVVLALVGSLSWVSCEDGVSSRAVGAWVLVRYSDYLVLSDNGVAAYALEQDGLPGSVRGKGNWETKKGTLRIDVIEGYFEIANERWEEGQVIEARYSIARTAMTLTIEQLENPVIFIRLD